MKKADYLIIGNGIAGLSAVKEIRKNDKDASIIMVGNEPFHTYYRIKLTALISEDYTKDGVLVNKPEWYEENKVEVLLNTIVEKLDLENKKVVLDDSSEIEYGKLLIATGSRPFIPPIEGKYKKGLFALRELRDLDYIKNYIEDKEEIAVIGGGLLGLEAAWALKQLGKNVHILEHGPGILRRQLDQELSDILTEELKAMDMQIHMECAAEEILGEEDTVDGIKFCEAKGNVDVDAILASTGVRPNLELVRDTELKIDRGLLVNNKLETNIEDVYGAGDVIELDGTVLGLWTASMEQGKIAGSNMSGGDMSYDVPKLFASLNIGDINLFSAGEFEDVEEVYEYRDGKIIQKIFVEDGKMVGAILYGDTKPMMKFRNAVFSKEAIGEFLEKNDLRDKFVLSK